MWCIGPRPTLGDAQCTTAHFPNVQCVPPNVGGAIYAPTSSLHYPSFYFLYQWHIPPIPSAVTSPHILLIFKPSVVRANRCAKHGYKNVHVVRTTTPPPCVPHAMPLQYPSHLASHYTTSHIVCSLLQTTSRAPYDTHLCTSRIALTLVMCNALKCTPTLLVLCAP